MTMSELKSTANINGDHQTEHYSDGFESDSSLHQEHERSSGANTKTPTSRRSWTHTHLSNFHSSSTASYVRGEVPQRVFSAKRLKINELRNKIQSLQMTMKDLEDENRLLKRVQKRQEKELLRYDSQKGELPDIFKSHTLEVHSLQNQLRQVKSRNTELERSLNTRDRHLNRLQEEMKKLQKVVQEQGLLEKRDLTLQIDSLDSTIKHTQSQLQSMKQQKDIATKNHKRVFAAKVSQLRDLQKVVTDLRNQNEKQANLLREKDKELLKWAMQGPQRKLSSRMPFLETASSRASISNRENNESNDISLPLLQSALQSPRKTNAVPRETNYTKMEIKHIDLNTAALVSGNIEENDSRAGADCVTSPTGKQMARQDNSESSVRKDQRGTDLIKKLPENDDVKTLVEKRSSSAKLAKEVVHHATTSSNPELREDKKKELLAKLKAMDSGSSRHRSGSSGSRDSSDSRKSSKASDVIFGSYQPSFQNSLRNSQEEGTVQSNASKKDRKSSLMESLFGKHLNDLGDAAANGNEPTKNDLLWA